LNLFFSFFVFNKFNFSVIELEKVRQANLRNEFENAAKKILVENIKVCFKVFKEI